MLISPAVQGGASNPKIQSAGGAAWGSGKKYFETLIPQFIGFMRVPG